MNDDFEDEFEDDRIFCPCCFEKTAIIINSEVRGEIAVCTECKYKWKELLEPNHLFKKYVGNFTYEDLNANKEMELEYIGDNENIFDIYDDDNERYELIIKFSDLRLEKNLPSMETTFIWKKQDKYFLKKANDKAEKSFEENSTVLNNFIKDSKSVSIKSVLYVLEYHCGLPGFKVKNDSYIKVETIACKDFNINALKMFQIEIDDLEKSLNECGIKLIKFDNYNLYSEEEMNILNGITSISNEDIKVKESLDTVKVSEIKNILNDFDSVEVSTDNEKNKNKKEEDFDLFLQRQTSYGVTVETLYEDIKECTPIGGFVTSKPFIIDIEEFLSNYKEYYTDFPSLIDYDNKIVFLHISHKDLIETMLENYFSKEINFCNSFDEREQFFHKKINCSQIYVNSRNRDKTNPLMITNSNRGNILRDKFFKNLDTLNIKYDNIFIKSENDDEIIEDYFVVLNKINNMVEGDVYFPKPNEESIPEGKILVIPTASEEYFLPSLSSMNGNGCIITERGSKTSHIVLMSKEFNFNIILIENAIEKFKDGDNLVINLEDLIIYKK